MAATYQINKSALRNGGINRVSVTYYYLGREIQDVEANPSTVIDVWVVDRCCKGHNRRLKRISDKSQRNQNQHLTLNNRARDRTNNNLSGI